MRKVTKRDMFLTMRGVLVGMDGNEDIVAFIDHEIELLDHKANTKPGPTKAQIANDIVKTDILCVLMDSGPRRATEIAGVLGLSVQKVTALLRQMVMADTVERDQDGKVITFRNAG